MGTLALGFLAAWTAVAVYVGWLGLQQQRLSRRLDAAQRRDKSAAPRRAAGVSPSTTCATTQHAV